MVGIKDVAKKSGVSISTVSYALNGSSKVTEKTRAKIVAIANELNYIPNAAGRTLKKQETKIIGAFLGANDAPFFGELLHGMRLTLNNEGYNLIVCAGKESYRFLPEGIIDGALILDLRFSDEEIIRHADRGHKLTVLDREIDHPNIGKVLLDNKRGAELAMEFLKEKEHKFFYIVTGPIDVYDSNQRLQGVLNILKQHPSLNYRIIPGGFDKASGEQAAQKIADNYSEPVAVFSFNDEMAIGMYDYFDKTDYIIGEHIHIIGFDNVEVSHYIRPRLSTIHYSKKEWGERAAEQLIRLIKGEESETHIIAVELLKGDSVKSKRQIGSFHS